MTGRRARTPGRRRNASDVVFSLVGEMLVVAGVFVGLFVVWQSWWTDVEGERRQAGMVSELGRPAPASTPAPNLDDDPDPMAEPSGTGDIIGTLLVPRWGADYERPIAQGTDRETVLNEIGLGHYPGTAMPGGVGNFSVAGHRVTYGKPLNLVAELRIGDAMIVRAPDAKGVDTWFVYRTIGNSVVTPEHTEVIAPVPGHPGEPAAGRYITLTACHPMWSAKERFIVTGELTGSIPVSSGTPTEILKGPKK